MTRRAQPRKLRFVNVQQHRKSFYLVSLTAADIVRMSYVARRGESDEEGAVQRLLNPTRISSIRDFVLAGGRFPDINRS